jgi:putative methyltransferase (TIGR04325 family)
MTLYRNLKSFLLNLKYYGYKGTYHSWQQANKQCSGYNDDAIFQKVLAATLSVQKGEAAFERDTVLFKEPDYEWFLLGCLQDIAINEKQLHVADFGGALGSTYFQHKRFLSAIQNLSWNIIEQEKLTQAGMSEIREPRLNFYQDLDACFISQAVNVVLLRCVLPYLENPYQWLQKILDLKPKYLIIDNNPFVDTDDFVSVQKVPPSIYKASYPAWFFNRNKMMAFVSGDYELIAKYKYDWLVNKKCSYEGLYLKREKGFFG